MFKFNFKDHREISPDIAAYLTRVADISDISELSIEQINTFLNDQEEWLNGRVKDGW